MDEKGKSLRSFEDLEYKKGIGVRPTQLTHGCAGRSGSLTMRCAVLPRFGGYCANGFPTYSESFVWKRLKAPITRPPSGGAPSPDGGLASIASNAESPSISSFPAPRRLTDAFVICYLLLVNSGWGGRRPLSHPISTMSASHW